MVRGIDTRPYLEWLDGIESVVMSPNNKHGFIEIATGEILNRCGRGIGRASAEVHLRLSGENERKTVLLPDVSFFKFEALRDVSVEDRLLPTQPPEIIVEVRSPNDRPGFREEKIRRYRAWGCPLVLDVDPETLSLTAHAADGVQKFDKNDHFSHPAATWLTFRVSEVFEGLDLLGF